MAVFHSVKGRPFSRRTEATRPAGEPSIIPAELLHSHSEELGLASEQNLTNPSKLKTSTRKFRCDKALVRPGSAAHPPRRRGPTCSAEKDCGENASWLRQYSQQAAARSRTCAGIDSVTRPLATPRDPEAEVVHHRLDRSPPKPGQFDQGLRPTDRETLGLVDQTEQLSVVLRR